MGKILEILSLLVGLVPVVISLIKAFEVPGFGAEKKQAVLNAIGLFYDNLGITIITKDKLLGIVSSLCDIIVALLNVVGWFKVGNPI